MTTDGLPYQYVSIRTDITAIKKTEAALRESEERLSRSQTYANIGTWDWNIQTGGLYWSERIGPLFGYDGLVETSYENFLNAVHPDDRQKVVDAVAACIERGEKYEIEHRVVWPDGSLRWMLERGDVTREKDGSPSHMLGVVQDITERKLAEHKLQASEASLANAQRIAHLGNWDYDQTSGQIVWSDEVYRIFGLDPSGISPNIESYYEWTHPDDRERLHNAEEQTMREGKGEILHRIVRPDGSIRHVHLIGEVGTETAGQSLRMTGTVHDITTIKLAEASLRAAKEVAEQANQAKSIFLSSMSHELRTPMNAILGFAQLLRMQNSMTEDQSENVEEILTAGRHLLGLINEVLDLSKIEAGHLELFMEQLSCCEIVQESLSLVRSMADRHGITAPGGRRGALPLLVPG